MSPASPWGRRAWRRAWRLLARSAVAAGLAGACAPVAGGPGSGGEVAAGESVALAPAAGAPSLGAAAGGGVDSVGALAPGSPGEVDDDGAVAVDYDVDFLRAGAGPGPRAVELAVRHGDALRWRGLERADGAQHVHRSATAQVRGAGRVRVRVRASDPAVPLESGPLVRLRFARAPDGRDDVQLDYAVAEFSDGAPGGTVAATLRRVLEPTAALGPLEPAPGASPTGPARLP